MTWRPSRSVPAVLLLATTLAGCGLAPADEHLAITPGVTAPAATASPSGPALAQAEAVARSWTGSAAAKYWHQAYDPLDVPGLWLPPGGFRSPADANAYRAGELDLRATLPYTPATGTVRWADGSTGTLPLVPIAQLIRNPPSAQHCAPGEDCALPPIAPHPTCAPNESCAAPIAPAPSRSAGCPSHQCPSWLVVTAVAPGTREVDTSRGQATIPVWQLTVEGYQSPFTFPAVTRTPGPSLPPPSGPPVIPGLAPVEGWTALSPDGLTLSAHEEAGGCDQALPGQVYETDSVVVLIGQRTITTGDQACPADLASAPADFRLSHPLGSRDVLDAATGRPIPRTLVQPGGPMGSPAS
ncbi:hypothetical protein [Kitasatospora kifunensis]|uniref:Secreted protein n=1 Tax=Kitasatospora kifunensis TaxID=58351 RepID=A0A7W7QZW6_KITKI|nr:hypothetical protein [Kitasatospora kifunensis]MBB4922779.1 hypothetical protein [Kitasatospora kifunensis]